MTEPTTPGGKFAKEVLEYLKYINFDDYFYKLSPQEQDIYRATMALYIEMSFVLLKESKYYCALVLFGMVAEWLNKVKPEFEMAQAKGAVKH